MVINQPLVRWADPGGFLSVSSMFTRSQELAIHQDPRSGKPAFVIVLQWGTTILFVSGHKQTSGIIKLLFLHLQSLRRASGWGFRCLKNGNKGRRYSILNIPAFLWIFLPFWKTKSPVLRFQPGHKPQIEFLKKGMSVAKVCDLSYIQWWEWQWWEWNGLEWHGWEWPPVLPPDYEATLALPQKLSCLLYDVECSCVALDQCPTGRVFQYRVGSGIRQNTG